MKTKPGGLDMGPSPSLQGHAEGHDARGALADQVKRMVRPARSTRRMATRHPRDMRTSAHTPRRVQPGPPSDPRARRRGSRRARAEGRDGPRALRAAGAAALAQRAAARRADRLGEVARLEAARGAHALGDVARAADVVGHRAQVEHGQAEQRGPQPLERVREQRARRVARVARRARGDATGSPRTVSGVSAPQRATKPPSTSARSCASSRAAAVAPSARRRKTCLRNEGSVGKRRRRFEPRARAARAFRSPPRSRRSRSGASAPFESVNHRPAAIPRPAAVSIDGRPTSACASASVTHGMYAWRPHVSRPPPAPARRRYAGASGRHAPADAAARARRARAARPPRRVAELALVREGLERAEAVVVVDDGA